MRRLSLAPLLMWAASAVAQPVVPSPAAPAGAPPERPQAVSPETAALLAAALPKTTLAKPAASAPAAEAPDRRETDKPRNSIVRLPKYVVRESRPPVFTERELSGEQAFGERLAKRYYFEGYFELVRLARYTPLTLFLPSAEASALAQYEDGERLRKKAEFADLTNMVMKSNPTTGAKVQDAVQDTFMRWGDFGWGSTK